MRRVALNNRKNFSLHLRRAAFVSIQTKNPFVAAGFDATVAQIAKPVEIHLHDPGAEPGGNIKGAISTVRVNQHDFISPLHTLQGSGNFFGLIESNDVNRNFAHSMAVKW